MELFVRQLKKKADCSNTWEDPTSVKNNKTELWRLPCGPGVRLRTSTAEAKIPTCGAFYKLEWLLHSVLLFLT